MIDEDTSQEQMDKYQKDMTTAIEKLIQALTEDLPKAKEVLPEFSEEFEKFFELAKALQEKISKSEIDAKSANELFDQYQKLSGLLKEN